MTKILNKRVNAALKSLYNAATEYLQQHSTPSKWYNFFSSHKNQVYAHMILEIFEELSDTSTSNEKIESIIAKAKTTVSKWKSDIDILLANNPINAVDSEEQKAIRKILLLLKVRDHMYVDQRLPFGKIMNALEGCICQAHASLSKDEYWNTLNNIESVGSNRDYLMTYALLTLFDFYRILGIRWKDSLTELDPYKVLGIKITADRDGCRQVQYKSFTDNLFRFHDRSILDFLEKMPNRPMQEMGLSLN